MASAHLAAGDEEKAAEWFQRIIESTTERVEWPIPYVRCFYFLGQIHENRGEMEKARKYVPRFSSRYLDFSSKRSVDWYARTAKLSRSGVMGDPTKASREKGEKMWAVMIKNLVELVEHLKGMSLDEIYQRNRY